MRLVTSSLFNALLFNFIWLGCVAGRDQYLWIVAPLVLAYTAVLLKAGQLQLRQTIWVVITGIFVDSLYTASGIFRFEHDGVLLPLWMCILWVGFATTLPLSMRIFSRPLSLATVTGAAGFPFSYFIGTRLDAVEFGLPFTWTMVMVAITWAVVLPIMYRWMSPQEGSSHAVRTA